MGIGWALGASRRDLSRKKARPGPKGRPRSQRPAQRRAAGQNDRNRHATPHAGTRETDGGRGPWVDIGQTLGGIQHPARHARAQRVRGRGAGLSGGAHQVWERPSGEQGAAFVFRRSQTTLLEVGRSSSQSAFRIASLAVGMGEEGRTMVPDGEAQLRAALPLETRGQRTLARTRCAHVR